MKALAVDLGGSHATCALVEDRTIIGIKTPATIGSKELAGVLPKLAEALQTIMSETDTKPSYCEGLALCFCGLADHAHAGVASTNARYDYAPQLDLPDWCKKSLAVC